MVELLIIGSSIINNRSCILAYNVDLDEFIIVFCDFSKFSLFDRIKVKVKKEKEQRYRMVSNPMKIGSIYRDGLAKQLDIYKRSIISFNLPYCKKTITLVKINRIIDINANDKKYFITFESGMIRYSYRLKDPKIIKYLKLSDDSIDKDRTSSLIRYMNTKDVNNYAILFKNAINKDNEILFFHSV